LVSRRVRNESQATLARPPPAFGVRVTPAFLLSALLAATAAAAPPTSTGPILKDGVEITVLLASGGSQTAVTEVGLDIEATTNESATRFGFHSLRAVADVDCARGVNRFVSAEAYDQPGFGGAGRSRTVTGAWVAPTSDSFMAPVLARVCGGQKVAAAGPPPVVKEMAQPAPAKVSVPPLTARTLPPAAAAPAVQLAPQAAPQVASQAAPSAPPPPAPPLVVRMDAAAPAAPAQRAYSPEAAPQPAAYTPKIAGDRVAQVAASANLQDAEKALRELKRLIEPPLTSKIEQAVIGSAHVYRADVVGFQTAADAKAFCRSAAPWSKTCWVRAKGDAPAPKPAEHLRAAKRAG
jgi:hypothetical protein